MHTGFTRETALKALQQYNKEAFHIQHALTVEKAMRWFACDLGYGEDADFWGLVGLMHDIDFEMWPDEHCIKCIELLEKINQAIMELTDDGTIQGIINKYIK